MALPDAYRDRPIRVYSRNPDSRGRFVDRARTEFGLDVSAARSAEEAVRAAEVVVLATSSATPVVEAEWIRPGAYVAPLGPKQVGRAEFDPSIARTAAFVVSDSPAQVGAYDPPNVLVGSGLEGDLVHLGAVLAGDAQPPEGTRVFFSVGLAGTEAWLLDAVTR
ncbi:hypothetical protein [Mobilicoccus massiliensis]|uniref:hypothetical protein n=1 Tax=Mobilicoccus massiliensis TaxID=1522310 RepID=UPI0006947C5B|nr:hypothetical protein [Mobilicoccus massiliensis]